MPFADEYIELAHRGRELREQVDKAREKARLTKTRKDLKAYEDIHRKYKRHLNEVRKAVMESAEESRKETLNKAKKAVKESKDNKKIPTLDELLSKVTPENRHDEMFVVPVGKEII